MYSKLISFIIFISVVVAVPTISVQNQSCDSKSIHCCNQVHSSKSSMIQNQLENASGFFGHFFGLDCVPAAGQGATGNNCASQALCCSNTAINGYFTYGCKPSNFNP